MQQGYFGVAIGKGRQAAKTEIEKLKLTELTCREAVFEIARMYLYFIISTKGGKQNRRFKSKRI